MGLETGTRLGPYEILEAIGARGMGDAYRRREALEALTQALPFLDPEARRTLEAFIQSQR